MEDSKKVNKSSNKIEENKLKSAYLFLTNEYNSLKKEKLNSLNEELKITKLSFQEHIKQYQKDVLLTLEREKEIEQLFSKISKTKKRRALIMNNSFNDKFYHHLLEIIDNSEKGKILKNFFSLILYKDNKEERSIKDILEILKDKEEIKNLIYYSGKIYSDLRVKDENEFLNLKKKFDKYFSEIDDSEKRQYPFDKLFECVNIIFEIIDYKTKIKTNNIILEKLTEKKNAKFVEIKILELKIKNLNKKIKMIKNNLKILRSFCDRFHEQKSINSEQGLKELIQNIEEYQKQEKEFQKVNPPGDVITSLTFGTYYTQSEDSSVKSSKFSSKNGFGLFNNILNNNENILEANRNNISQMNPYDTVLKSISNFNYNDEVNERNNKKINEEKPKVLEKNGCKNANKNLEQKNNNDKKINLINKYMENFNKNKNIKQEKKITADKNNSKINEQSISIQSTAYNYKDKIKNEGKKSKKENKENLKSSNNQIKEEKEIINEKKVPYNFTELHNLGSRMNQLKHREPDDSIEMSMPRENINNIDDINKENLFNDNSICDEMVSMNFDIPNNNWKNNDYINKIGIKNNLVVSKELYKNKLFMRKNNNGRLQIEKSVEASTCCVSCT